MRDYRELDFYRDMYALALELYPVLKTLPPEERYGLAAQMRSSAVSVLSNIAEGSGRATLGENANSISNASGSAAELSCQLDLSRDLHFIPHDLANSFQTRLTSIRRRLHGYYKYLKR